MPPQLIYFVLTLSLGLGSGSFSRTWPLREGYLVVIVDKVTVGAIQRIIIFFTLLISESYVMDIILNDLLKPICHT